ncbi:MAG: hypothetical protein AAGB93_00510 [Planctomycetota bacterium]
MADQTTNLTIGGIAVATLLGLVRLLQPRVIKMLDERDARYAKLEERNGRLGEKVLELTKSGAQCEAGASIARMEARHEREKSELLDKVAGERLAELERLRAELAENERTLEAALADNHQKDQRIRALEAREAERN